MIQSPEQYDSTIKLLTLLQQLDLKKASDAEGEFEDAYAGEWSTCYDCGNVRCECECRHFDEDFDYDYEPKTEDRGSEASDSKDSGTDGSGASSS